MKNFKQKRSGRKILESPPFLILLTLIVFIFAWNMFGLWGRMRDTAKNRQIAEAKVSELTQGKEKLSYDIAKLETQAGVEESIREKFGLAKEGERMIIVVEDKNPPQTEEKKPKGFFSRLKTFFTNDKEKDKK